jgi:predicted RNA-binding protein with EMAP domain
MRIRISVLLLCLPLSAIVTFAHDGMEHVMGTVKTISANSVTVETATKEAKTITVALLPSTKFVKSGTDGFLKDLKVGDRVMVEAKENSNNKLEAVSVAFGKQPPNSMSKKNVQH